MKRITISALTILLFISCQANGQDGFHKIKSSHSVDATVTRLSDVLTAKGMTIFSTIDHQQGAIKAGLDLRPTVLVIFGNPKVGTALMQCDQRIGLALPLKMLIWQDDAGVTWLGYQEPSKLKNEYNLDSCSETLAKVKNAMANFARAATSAG
jgi:uncharacterized protein (DUF302 family)